MSEQGLITQLKKEIESAYKEKAYLYRQIDELHSKIAQIDEKISVYEKTMEYIDPTITLNKTPILAKPRSFRTNIQKLVSQVFKANIERWWMLDELTIEMLKIDRCISVVNVELLTPKICLAVYNVLRKLRAKNMVEQKLLPLQGQVEHFGYIKHSAWRLKQI